MRWGTTLRPSADGTRHDAITVVHLETAQDIHDLRANEDFHEGAMSVLTYPTAPPNGFISHDGPPRSFGGIRFMPGAYITKDAAGNFGFLADEKGFIPA